MLNVDKILRHLLGGIFEPLLQQNLFERLEIPLSEQTGFDNSDFKGQI